MQQQKERSVIIIGAGLTGLALAWQLSKKGVEAIILEARNRLGGRILTAKSAPNQTPIELGATWLGSKHKHLTQLLEALEVPIFKQILGEHAIYEYMSVSPPQLVQLPPDDAPSYRIAGGTSRLIHQLAERLPNPSIHLDEPVLHLALEDTQLSVETTKAVYHPQLVVSTLPPYLLINTINITPSLPAELLQIAQQTHTWMGESIKIGLRYPEPFWREYPKSGTLFSNVGPITELYDHSTYTDDLFALKGFLNGVFHATTKEHRLEIVLKQLSKYYGQEADGFVSYEEMVWRNEPYTFKSYGRDILPHQNNGHFIFRKPYFKDRLLIAGSETAPSFPGYMDGAIESAFLVAERIFQYLRV